MTKVNEARSVSHGTMRLEDLIPTFISELEDRQNDNQYTVDGDELDCVARNTRHTALLAGIESRIESADYYESDEANWDLEGLFDALDEYAADGFRFGAHDGDGSDYGYWPIEEDEEDEEPTTDPDFLVCEDCLQAIANDDYSGLDYHYPERDSAKREKAIRAGIAELCGEDGYLVVADGEGSFSWQGCDCCGDGLGGTKHGVNRMTVPVSA